MKNIRTYKNVFYLFGLGIIILLVGILIFLLFNIVFASQPITNISEYESILQIETNKEKMSHFPKVIPCDAKDVKLYCISSSANGALFLLQFKINKEYIQNELNRLTFINYNRISDYQRNIYYFPHKMGFINPKNLNFYVLKNKDNEQAFKKYFPYFSGIGVDQKFEHIIYYYIEPDD